MWLINQRNSRHGVEFGYNLPGFDLNSYYLRYCETLLSVDENLGRILQWVEKNSVPGNTLVIYMGDNGFQFGEQGLIDKRTAYEASIRVPLLLWWPGKVDNRIVVDKLVANIDLAPTILDLAGVEVPGGIDGKSLRPLIVGEEVQWREDLVYEYYWERNYPYTPTIHALVTGRYKFIRYQGIWDLDEFYDLKTDPQETTNLIRDEGYQDLIGNCRNLLFEHLSGLKAGSMPLVPDRGKVFPLRHPDKSDPAGFPESFFYREDEQPVDTLDLP
jgi:N-acetylglucosamine-6-sulfatase